MRRKSKQGELDNFIYKRIGSKEGLKEKAMRKNRQLLNPKFLFASYKDRMERMLKAKDLLTPTGHTSRDHSAESYGTPKILTVDESLADDGSDLKIED